MKLIRRLHLLSGCLFAPLLIYFALSGAWQTLGWQDADTGSSKNIYHELSNPHLNQTLPGAKRTAQSPLFGYFAVTMALGFCLSASLGITLAFRFFRPRWVVSFVLALGVIIPLLFLYLAAYGKS